MVETLHTVLIVEGDDDTRRMLRSLLQDEGWRTLEAASAAQARGLLRSETKVNAVLLDLGRPGSREALELSESLMKDGPGSRQLPVILTGTSSHEAVAPPLSGLPFIIKPYVFENLLRTLEREVWNVHARRIEAGGQGDARCGDGA